MLALFAVLVVVAAALAGGRQGGGGGGRGGCLAAAPAGFRGQAFDGAAGVFFLACVPGGEDALVADGEQRRGESISGARPVRRHQPRAVSLLAGSFAVAKPRSAPVRRP